MKSTRVPSVYRMSERGKLCAIHGLVCLYCVHKHVMQAPSAYCRSERGELCSVPGLQGTGAAVEVDRSRARLQLTVIAPVPTLAEAQKHDTC